MFSLRGIGDVEAVRGLASLPETATELEALAHNLEASPDSLLLREDATEPNLRSIDLERYRILAFATHAIVAGELKGLSEPALVLTPPDVGTEEDDGLLTASEVASLKLDADWVILSACNTVRSDRKQARPRFRRTGSTASQEHCQTDPCIRIPRTNLGQIFEISTTAFLRRDDGQEPANHWRVSVRRYPLRSYRT